MTRLLSLLVLALCAVLPLGAQTELHDELYNKKTGTRLTVTAMTSTLPATGYIAIRVRARNGEKIPLKWTFNCQSFDKSWGNDRNELSSSFSLSCPSGEQREFEFLVPLVTSLQDEELAILQVSVNASGPLSDTFLQMDTRLTRSWPSIVMSEDLFASNSSRLNAQLSSSSSHHRYSPSDFAGSFNPRTLSSAWKAYLGYDAMMLTSSDWNLIPPGAKTAILKWNRLGGKLFIYKSSDTVTLASLGIKSEGSGSPNKATRSWGQVQMLTLPSSGNLDPASTVTLLTPKSSQLAPKIKLHSEGFSRGSATLAWPLQSNFGERSFNPAFFMIILIIFGIVVGPVNLFVFAKSGQRHKLFVTTPIISLTASALLLIVILFQDGFGGKGHRLSLIEIRPDENTAYISQQQIARAGVLLSTAFPIEPNSHVSPLALAESRWTRVTSSNYGGGSRYRILDGDDNTQKLSGDWFKSRSEYGHLTTSVQSTRARLELLSPNGPPTLSSTFDYPLDKVYYTDNSGGHWQSSGAIKSGKKMQLSPLSANQFNAVIKEKLNSLDPDSKKRLQRTVRRKNHFFALSSEGPFIETLPSLSWEESNALITGPVVNL